MKRKTELFGFSICFILITAAFYLAKINVEPIPSAETRITAAELKFSGEKAYRHAVDFASSFPNRNSGTDNFKNSITWLNTELTKMGYSSGIEEFQSFLYGKQTTLYNAYAVKKGQLPQAIAVVAHADQARTTVQGADNDASGVGILLELAELFPARQQQVLHRLFSNRRRRIRHAGCQPFYYQKSPWKRPGRCNFP